MIELDPLASDPLAQRLDRLAVAVPPIPLTARATARSASHRRLVLRSWRSGAAAAGVAAALALAVTAAGYPGGLAALTHDALQAAGLSRDQVVPLSGSSANQELKVSVTGGYADQISTVLFVSIDQTCQAPDRTCGIGGPYLTDQFGTRYNITGGEGIGVGAYPIFFEPLTGPAASGAHLILYVPGNEKELAITLSGTLIAGVAHQLAIPAPVVDNSSHVTYKVRGLTYSNTYLEVHTRLTGQLENVIVHYRPSGQELSGESWPGVYVVDPSGRWEIPLAFNGGRPTVNNQVQDETRIFSISRPGTYHLVVATSGARNSAPGPTWKTLAEWTIVVR
jgi:hypothetical protein